MQGLYYYIRDFVCKHKKMQKIVFIVPDVFNILRVLKLQSFDSCYHAGEEGKFISTIMRHV